MATVLITAFDAYDQWEQNSSWLTLIELTRNLPDHPTVVTRRYPVDFAVLRDRLASDLAANYDYALHLGQAPGTGRIVLESVGINVATRNHSSLGGYDLIDPDGPVAYRSSLPLVAWAEKIRHAGIPAEVSFHAGTYVCNATLYLSCLLAEQMALKTRSAFVHLPLDISQAVDALQDTPTLPAATSAAALRLLLDEMAIESEV